MLIKPFKEFFIIVIDTNMDTEFFNNLIKNQSIWKDKFSENQKNKRVAQNLLTRIKAPQYRESAKLSRLMSEGKI